MGDQAEDPLTRSLKVLAGSVAWVGASVSGIGIILTTFGVIVRHSYLDSLGVPRTAYEAKASEYLIAGGNFLLGLLLLALVGLSSLLVHGWWLLLLVAAIAALAWRRRWSASRRLLLAGLVYGVWLGTVMTYFAGNTKMLLAGAEATDVVAMLSATTFLGAGYLATELTTGRRAYQVWLPLALLLACGLMVLPYLRGAHAILVTHPLIEPLGPERSFFDELAGSRPSGCEAYDACPEWRLVEMGESKVILRRVSDGSIVVLPSEKLAAFRILPTGKTP